MESGSIFGKNMGVWFLEMIGKATEQAYVFVLEIIKRVLTDHWHLVLLGLIVIFFFSFSEYIFTGRWKSLGSFTFNVLKYSILLAIAFVFGAGIFAKDWFEIVIAVIGFICYIVVGKIFKR